MRTMQEIERQFIKNFGWGLYQEIREDEAKPCEGRSFAEYAWPSNDLPATIMCAAENALRLPGLSPDIHREIYDLHQSRWTSDWLDFVLLWNIDANKFILYPCMGFPEYIAETKIREIPGASADDSDGRLKAREMYELARFDIPKLPLIFRTWLLSRRSSQNDACVRISHGESVAGNHVFRVSINLDAKHGFPEKEDRVFHTFRVSADALAAASSHICDTLRLVTDKIEAMKQKTSCPSTEHESKP